MQKQKLNLYIIIRISDNNCKMTFYLVIRRSDNQNFGFVIRTSDNKEKHNEYMLSENPTT